MHIAQYKNTHTRRIICPVRMNLLHKGKKYGRNKNITSTKKNEDKKIMSRCTKMTNGLLGTTQLR